MYYVVRTDSISPMYLTEMDWFSSNPDDAAVFDSERAAQLKASVLGGEVRAK